MASGVTSLSPLIKSCLVAVGKMFRDCQPGGPGLTAHKGTDGFLPQWARGTADLLC